MPFIFFLFFIENKEHEKQSMESKMMNEGGWTLLPFGHACMTDGSQALLPLIWEEHE